ncbi:MAG: type IV toxin-antitoxin system AbiEi family antitoxin domain-containing protein [Verrucomicrobiales bacterium]|nr:type IV toxin-antitoxin system AbiEi family antitoxin domain-containing protein [Verrucomicrobiales bacterium]
MEEKLLNLIESRGLVRTCEVVKAGIPRVYLSRLIKKGRIVRVSRGVYELASPLEISEHHSLAEVASVIPGGVICVLSALAFHNIGTQIPECVWVAIANKRRSPQLSYPPVRIVKMSPKFLETGIETNTIDGVEVSITTPPRSVADCFKFRNDVGLDVAIEALRDGLKKKQFSRNEFAIQAQSIRIWNVVRPYLESIQ